MTRLRLVVIALAATGLVAAGAPAGAATATSAPGVVGATTTPAATKRPVKVYKNCAALNRDYPHGVGRPGARDKTSRTPVKNFTVDRAVYTANAKHRDADRDGIACEKR